MHRGMEQGKSSGTHMVQSGGSAAAPAADTDAARTKRMRLMTHCAASSTCLQPALTTATGDCSDAAHKARCTTTESCHSQPHVPAAPAGPLPHHQLPSRGDGPMPQVALRTSASTSCTSAASASALSTATQLTHTNQGRRMQRSESVASMPAWQVSGAGPTTELQPPQRLQPGSAPAPYRSSTTGSTADGCQGRSDGDGQEAAALRRQVVAALALQLEDMKALHAQQMAMSNVQSALLVHLGDRLMERLRTEAAPRTSAHLHPQAPQQ